MSSSASNKTYESLADTRQAGRGVDWPGLVVLVALSVVLIYARGFLDTWVSSRTQQILLTSALLSLVWSAASALVVALSRDRRHAADRTAAFRVVALLLAVGPAVLQTYILIIRIVFASLDLTHGDSLFADHVRIFAVDGLWTILALTTAAVLCLVASGQRALLACLFWLLAMSITWWLLLSPDFRTSQTIGHERAGSSVYIIAALSLLFWGTVLVTRAVDRRLRWRWALTDPDRLKQEELDWPGLNRSGAAVLLALIILCAFHLAVPVTLSGWSAGGTMLLVGFSCLVAAIGGFLRISVSYSRGLAETATALATLAIACFAVATLPATSEPLAKWYPRVFAAMIVGLSSAAFIWSWVYGVWQQQLDDGKPWTPAGRMIPVVARFGFYSAAMGLVVALLLALWPRLRGIPTMDDSLMAMLAGIAVNLFLILVTVRMARQFRRLTFQSLAWLAIASLISFVILRILPFSPHFG